MSGGDFFVSAEIRNVLTEICEDRCHFCARRRASWRELVVTDAARDKLLDEGYDSVYGARPLKRVIQRRLEDALSEEILANKVSAGQKVKADVEGDKFVFVPMES